MPTCYLQHDWARVCFVELLWKQGGSQSPAGTLAGDCGEAKESPAPTNGVTQANPHQAMRLAVFVFQCTMGTSNRVKHGMKNGDQWRAMISAFEAYVRQNGNGEVPANYPENPALGRWVAMIRYRCRIGELESAFIAELDRQGFCWSPGDQLWETMFRNLVAFKAKFKHCNVPTNWTDDPHLASWLARQRHLRKLGTLSTERVRRLDEIGFRWTMCGSKGGTAQGKKRVEKHPAPQPAKSTIATAPPPKIEERLYHIGADGYVQYDGVREMPTKLRHYLACHDDWPPYIPLPTEPTRFLLWIDGSAKSRRIKWKGHGPLPADILAYVNENGCLPPQG